MKSLIAELELYAQQLRETTALDDLPEGDLGWRHNFRRFADTLEQIIKDHDPDAPKLPGTEHTEVTG